MEKQNSPQPVQKQDQLASEGGEIQEGLGLGLASGPDAGRLTQLQAAANASSQVKQLKQLQTGIGQSNQVQQMRKMQESAQNPALQNGMPAQLKSGIEQLSGHSMDDVNVHYDSSEPKKMGAHAFAQGTDIHLGPGQEQHLPHEAWHVAQQKQGRVEATTQLKGIGVNDDQGLEKEADDMGAKAMQMKMDDSVQAKVSTGKAVLQGKFKVKGGNTYNNKQEVMKAYYTIKRNFESKMVNNSLDEIVEKIIEYAENSNMIFHDSSWSSIIDAADGAIDNKDSNEDEVIEIEPKDIDWNSDVSDDDDQDGYKQARGGMSPMMQDELDDVDMDLYRNSKVKVTNNETNYTFTSSKVSNLVSGKGYNVKQSEYSKIFDNLSNETGLSISELSELLLLGLFETSTFNEKLKDYDNKVQNKLQFGLGLLNNEILGRSSSNLVEIAMVLGKTVYSDDDELFERLEKYGLFIPNQKDHNKIGGQKLSRIGHGNLQNSQLDNYLKQLLQKNQNLYKAIEKEIGADGHDEMLEKLQPLFEKYGQNFIKHFDVQFF